MPGIDTLPRESADVSDGELNTRENRPTSITTPLKLAFKQSAASLAVNATLGITVVWLLTGLLPGAALAGWAGLLGGVLLYRALLWQRFTRLESKAQADRSWRRHLLISATLNGLSWGLVGPLFLPHLSGNEQTLLVVIAAGLGAGAMQAYASVFRAYVYYLCGLITPMAIALALDDQTGTLALLTSLYGVGLLVLGWGGHTALVRSIHLAEQNDKLIHELSTVNTQVRCSNSALEKQLVAHYEYNCDQFKDFAQLGADVLWETDSELCFTAIFGEVQALFGVDQEELVGQSRLNVICQRYLGESDYRDHLETLAGHRGFANLIFQIERGAQPPIVLSSSGKPFFDKDGKFLGYRGVAKNITEEHSLAQQLQYQATHDVLTNLKNRREIERLLQRIVEKANSDDSEHALCYLDLDQFKVVNDTCGHSAGDELLRQISNLFRGQIRNRDTLGRLGGDEFCLLLEHCTLSHAESVANKLREAIASYQYESGGRVFQIGASIGVVPITRHSGDIEQIMSAADSACYAAKEAGRNRVYVHEKEDPTLLRRYGEMEWVSRITRALAQGSFTLYVQPIRRIEPIAAARESVQLLSLTPGEVTAPVVDDRNTHFEVLVRMIGEDGSTIPPGAFLSAAENYNLSPKLDRWIISETFRWLSARPEKLRTLELCSINLSGNSLGDDEFAQFVIGEFRRSAIPPEKICFEITETAAITRLAAATRLITSLSELGCHFALDDFGSGLSSFGYLKTLPVQFLKIDGQFIRDIVTDPIDLAMVKSINEVGQVLGKQTIAEFVENDQVLTVLRELGVNYAQGYGVGKPVPIEEVLGADPRLKTSPFPASLPLTSCRTTRGGQTPARHLRH